MLEGGGGETRYPPALSSDFAKTDISAKPRSQSVPHSMRGRKQRPCKLHIRRDHRTQRGDLLFKTRSTRLRHCLGRGEIPPPYIGLGGGKLSNLFLQCFFSYYCLVRSISQLWWWKSLTVSRCSKYTQALGAFLSALTSARLVGCLYFLSLSSVSSSWDCMILCSRVGPP